MIEEPYLHNEVVTVGVATYSFGGEVLLPFFKSFRLLANILCYVSRFVLEVYSLELCFVCEVVGFLDPLL